MAVSLSRNVLGMRNDSARARLAGAAIGVGTLVSVALGSFGPAADAVTEPPPPSITVTPNPVAQGSEVLITVGNCATEPRLKGQGINAGTPALYGIELTASGDSWTATFTPGRTHDLWIVAECEGAPSATILLDVDAPTLSFTRSDGLFWRPNDEPGRVYGTDCPPKTVATVVISRAGEESTYQAEVEEPGDWQIEFPALAPGETVTVSASCGDVTYEPISATREADTSTTSTVSTPAVDPGSAPPAAALPSLPSYTG